MAMPKGYAAWISELKKRYRATQIKAAIAVNSALIEFYWELGRDISEKYPGKKRNASFFDTLSHDLQQAIPDADGLSSANIRYAFRFFSLYSYTVIFHKLRKITIIKVLRNNLQKNAFVLTPQRIQLINNSANNWSASHGGIIAS